MDMVCLEYPEQDKDMVEVVMEEDSLLSKVNLVKDVS